jgi:SpoVK/Ycf46/Vps4 family AAA+-type ATPase
MTNENLEKHLKKAFKRCLRLAGSQEKLEQESGVSLGNTVNFLNEINMTLEKLVKIFPEMKISFSPYDRKSIKRRYYSEVEEQLLEYFNELKTVQKMEVYSDIKQLIEDNRLEKKTRYTKEQSGTVGALTGLTQMNDVFKCCFFSNSRYFIQNIFFKHLTICN